MLQTEIEWSLLGLYPISILSFACGKFGESFKARADTFLSCARFPYLEPFPCGRAPDVCLSSLPVMAWRHPDVCNRHQKSQAREDLRVYSGKTQVSCLGVLWEVVAKLVAQKLECDMQRLFCFGETNHTIPIILLRAMLHLFFSPDVKPSSSRLTSHFWLISIPGIMATTTFLPHCFAID
ncbi:hypothetical protein ACQKWADRAFT_123620 [Trichoderma austrokoningii]